MAKQLILVADSLGMTEATTSAGFLAMKSGFATSGRLNVVGAWAREVVKRYRGEDLGVELVLTSPHPILGYRPLTYAPTLMGGDGTFPTTVEDLLEHADAVEVDHELRAQLERAILWGISVSHLAVLEDSIWPRADLADVLFGLAEEFCIPLRLTPMSDENHLGYDAYTLARQRGIRTIDKILVMPRDAITSIARLLNFLEDELGAQTAGVTEVSVTFGADTPELQTYGTRTTLLIDAEELPQATARLTRLLAKFAITQDGYRETEPHRHPDLHHTT